MKDIAIIIPVFNRRDITLKCLSQLTEIIGQLSEYKFTIIVVDDGSTDGTSDAINEKFKEVIVLKGNGQLWWTGAINLGVSHALGNGCNYIMWLNDDLELDSKFLFILLQASDVKPNALIGSIKLHKQENNRSFIVTGQFIVEGFFNQIRDPLSGREYRASELPKQIDCDLLTGASILIPCDVFHHIGVLDDRKFPHNWGDFEFTRRAKVSGYECIVSTESIIYTDMDNPNYHNNYLISSTRLIYIKNLFDNHKYTYGFSRIWYASMMHKPVYIGFLLVVKRYMGLIKWLLLKLLLPKMILTDVVKNKR